MAVKELYPKINKPCTLFSVTRAYIKFCTMGHRTLPPGIIIVADIKFIPLMNEFFFPSIFERLSKIGYFRLIDAALIGFFFQ